MMKNLLTVFYRQHGWHKLICSVILIINSEVSIAQYPVYAFRRFDAVTADNAPVSFSHPNVNCNNCYIADSNQVGKPVDSYSEDIYERPTSSGSGASSVFKALDIVTT